MKKMTVEGFGIFYVKCEQVGREFIMNFHYINQILLKLVRLITYLYLYSLNN